MAMFKTHNEKDLDASYTSGQGKIITTFQKLVEVFGEPLGESGDGKCQCQRIIEFENGVKATIYDWKEYDKRKENVMEWHIWGVDKNAISEIEKVLFPTPAL